MADLTKQLLLKMLPELEEKIDKAFSEYLKLTGDPITKAEYVRRMLNSNCLLELKAADFRKKQKENLVIKYPILFADRVGKNLFFQFIKGFTSCNKFQSNIDLFLINEKYNKDPIASKRDRIYLFFRIVSDIYEFEDHLNEILQYLNKNKNKFVKTLSSSNYSNLVKYRREIDRNKRYSEIRNQIGSHDGDSNYFELGLNKADNDGYFIFAECLSNTNGDGVGSNSIIYNSVNLILAALNIDEAEFRDLAEHTLEIIGNCVDDFQLMFHCVYNEALADGQIYRENSLTR